jgi:maleamate amidohydrolase
VALEYIRQLIEAARTEGLPVIYTTGERRSDNWDAGSWRWKSTRADETGGAVHDDIDGNQIIAMIAPGPKDIVIKKQKPSVSSGRISPPISRCLGCDSVIIVGTTTSGCVRATVVDAFSLNYRRGLLRPQRGQPRRQLVRYARQIRRRGLNGPNPFLLESAAGRPVRATHRRS